MRLLQRIDALPDLNPRFQFSVLEMRLPLAAPLIGLVLLTQLN